MRWIASLVAETHRILMRGGVFLYPRDTKDLTKAGRLRLLYEANPIGIASSSRPAGRASTGREPILGVVPDSLHQRIGFVFGARSEVERIERYHRDHDEFEYERAAVRQRAACSRASEPSDHRNLDHVRTTSRSSPSPVHRAPARPRSCGPSSRSSAARAVNAALRRRRQLPPLRPQRDETRWPRPSERGDHDFSHFGPEANLFAELEGLFRSYGESGRGRSRKYLHDEQEAAPYGQEPGTFTAWEDLPTTPTCCSTKGCTARWSPASRHRPACRPADRRRAGHQSRMDPEAAPRQERPAAIRPRR